MISKVNAETRLVCLLGNPAHHSLSPIIHNAGFRELGLNYIYLAFEVDSSIEAIIGLRKLKILGFNITAPFKIEALQAVDVIDPIAKKTGSMNTGYWDKNELHGTNTDVLAIQKGLTENNRDLSSSNILLVGAGGAARAVLTACSKSHFMIVNRTRINAQNLKNEFMKEDITIFDFNQIPTLINQADIIINATTLGRHTEESWIPSDQLNPNHLVIDLVYRKESTHLIRDAKSAGASTIDGIEFLINQGVESFKLWTSKTPSIKAMFNAVSKVY